MSLTREQIEQLADHVEQAELQAHDITKITDDYPDMTFSDAYDVQWEIRRRKIERGARIVGMKMGLTSRAKMQQMGVETPIYGFLADYFERPDSGEIEMKDLIHPKVEAEIAFVTKAPLKGPGCHVGSVLAATDFVLPAVEIIDSRYRDFKFDLVSVIADNASSSRFVTGTRARNVHDVDLRNLGLVMEINGKVVELGAGAAVLGHPATSIAMLANMLGERGEEIPAGSVILSGAITAAVAVKAGDAVTLRAQDMGSVSMRFV
ncbi:hydratase/decarboxylase [Alcanivorax sp. S71-1-4]|uniref:Hydratase/decarboxylase n=1 Tax=Isoalcanivorax pacificus W11-5 TaxID=391936 RepID=A0A0B4XND2_9GAMM|nr:MULTISPECIES: 2-oxo-3-hexenedioate decarboxylase [Alcanivoracaceae]AJD47817.1 hydratase/decarboxylase [Isoalcanivorax pacificus W11-5]KAF0805857.1 hydratase/decarboxylase [Alcanivorax sp. S71-1-4]